MPRIILFDDINRDQLLPLCYTRAVSQCRTGIFTNEERWSYISASDPSILTADYLQLPIESTEKAIYVNAAIIPSPKLVQEIINLPFGSSLKSADILIATHREGNLSDIAELVITEETTDTSIPHRYIAYPWHIFQYAGDAISWDHEIRQGIDPHISAKDGFFTNSSILLQPEQTYIHENATISACTINAEKGPVIIDDGAVIMEGALIRGPLYLGKNAVIKMGAKIYGPTIIGPNSKVGGEITNSVIFENSNKGHEGYLGNSVIAEWCNLGADTNTSNLKNNYSNVSVYSYSKNQSIDTGTLFCGLIMGDHSKAGINTMFNTGTVCGIASNIFGAGFPSKHIPSFSWGGAHGTTTHQFDKFIETARRVMARRDKTPSDKEIMILEHIFNLTREHRLWERDLA